MLGKNLPVRRPKGLSFRENHLDGGILIIQRGADNIVAPPVGWIHLRQQERKKDDDRGDGKSSIQSGRGDIVVCQPPAALGVSDKLVEDEADNSPREVGQWCRWRNVADATEDDWGVQVSDWALGELLGSEVEDHGQECADQPEPLQLAINTRAAGEHSLWTDDTPTYESLALSIDEMRTGLTHQMTEAVKNTRPFGQVNRPDCSGWQMSSMLPNAQ